MLISYYIKDFAASTWLLLRVIGKAAGYAVVPLGMVAVLILFCYLLARAEVERNMHENDDRS